MRIHEVLAIFPAILSIASASYNVYNYDLSTPLFTPDGSLKQVEYASEASSHSHPMIIMPFSMGIHSMIIMATRNRSKRSQSRILQMPITQGKGGQSSLLFGINGVLSDCVSLLQVSREEIHSMNYHGAPIMSSAAISSPRTPFLTSKYAEKVAKAIADKCQTNTFGGGIRCFGAEIVVCDFQDAVVYVTQPSGSITEYHASDNVGEIIVGGEKRKRDQLYDLLRSKTRHIDMAEDANDEDLLIQKIVRLIVETMVEFYSADDKQSVESLIEEFDLVLAHSSKGVVRINGDRLIRSYRNISK